MKKIKGMIIAMCIMLIIPLVAGAAGVGVNGGRLYFNGGQTGTKVYSEIYDSLTSERGTVEDDEYYNVIAYVKVGSTEYNSKWRQGYAYKSANRVWYANESSYYNYESRANDYSSWGGYR